MADDRTAAGDADALRDDLARVKMLLDGGQQEEAVTLAEDLVARNPDQGAVHAAMGDARAAQGQWVGAVQSYELALDLDFDPGVMERLAVARGRAVRSASVSQRVATAGSPPGVAAVPAVDEPGDDGWGGRRLAGIVIAGVLLVTLLAFFFARAMSRPPELPGEAPLPAREAARRPGAPPPVPATTPQQPPGAVPGLPTSIPTASPETGPPVPERPGGEEPARPRRVTPAPTPTTASATEIVSSRDQHILDRLHFLRLQTVGSYRLPASMALDDYSGVGILTFRIPLPSNLAGFEQDVLTMCFRAAVGAMLADPDLNTLVVRFVTRVAGEDEETEDAVIFRAMVQRDKVKPWVERREMPPLDLLRDEILQDIWWDRGALERHVQGGRQ